MAVGNEVVGKLYSVARNIVGDFIFLGFASHSAVYNDACARFVVQDVGVLAQAVYDKARYGVVLEVEYVVRGAQHGLKCYFRLDCLVCMRLEGCFLVWLCLVVAVFAAVKKYCLCRCFCSGLFAEKTGCSV